MKGRDLGLLEVEAGLFGLGLSAGFPRPRACLLWLAYFTLEETVRGRGGGTRGSI